MEDITKDPILDSASGRTDEAVSSLKSSVISDAHQLADKAKEVGEGVLGHARQSAETQIAGGKERVAEGLNSVADAIRQTGEHLRSQNKSGLTEYVVRAADQVEAASDYLQGQSLSAVLADVGAFARREPAMFLGGAFALGLIGGRFLKASKGPPSTPASGRESEEQNRVSSPEPRRQRTAPRSNARANAAGPRRAQSPGDNERGDGSSPHVNGGSATKHSGAS